MKDKGAGRKAPRTKTGCWTCRERKVRCDERKPICSNCSRLDLGCAGYGARITFRDDTPRVIQRMDPVTDTQGCIVYDARADDHTREYRSALRYKTYTQKYFEKHKDIEIDADLLEPSDEPSPSMNSLSPYPTQSYPGAPYSHYRSQSDNSAAELDLAMSYRSWSGVPTPQRSPIAGPSQFISSSATKYPVQPHHADYPGRHQYPDYPVFAGQSAEMQSDRFTRQPHPQIVIDSSIALAEGNSDPRPYYSRDAGGLLTPGSLESAIKDGANVVGSPNNSMNLLIPPALSSRSRRSTMTSETTDSPTGPSPSSLKWAEHFGAQTGPTTIQLQATTEIAQSQQEAYKEVVANIKAMEFPFNEEDGVYLKHYFHELSGVISFPDRGAQNPFRLLLQRLCPADPALLHAILAFAATDLAHTDHEIDSDIRFKHARRHYQISRKMLANNLTYANEAQSTGALTTAYFLNLADVKDCTSLGHTETVLELVKSRSAAGRIYEGGICWTWYNATLGVLSSLFGGQVLIMPYLIETDQLPTPGQGNMFPFIKKSEDDRIEHTVISPMYVSQLRNWVLLSKLACLANSDLDVSGQEFANELNVLKVENEVTWNDRARIVDDLNADIVEEVFVTKWKSAVPVAQSIVLFYHALQLYTELLLRGSYSNTELKKAVNVIVRHFDKITAAKETVKRRFVLIPIFLCSILCPDFGMRKQVISKIAQAAGAEASWNKALEVANALLQQEMISRDADGKNRGYGSITWSDVHQRLAGIALF